MARGYRARAPVRTRAHDCVGPLYLWVETEGFGRLPNAQQVEYDLLHGEIQSLLNRGANKQVLPDCRVNVV